MSPDAPRAPFPDLSPDACRAMGEYAALLDRVFPMKPVHRRHLAANIRDLSAFLTMDRTELLGRDYLHSPQSLGAYLWYFLPWNVIRLTRLLSGLAFDPPEGAVIVDLGSGPLTVIQAMVLARPELVDRQLHVHCLDSTPRPMRDGRKLYHGLLDILGLRSRWKIHLVHAPWQAALRRTPHADLLTAANFMNELSWHRRDPLSEQVADFFAALSAHVRGNGRCLFLEPGNRLGGKLTSMLRDGAVGQGWNVLAPCTHARPCPMLGNPRETSWCHFSVSTQGCPAWLADISRQAELGKRDLSLSFAYLAGPQSSNPALSGETARIISGEFPLPEERGRRRTGRYACSAKGKLLLVSFQEEPGTASGDVVKLDLPRSLPRDPRSGALTAALHAFAKAKTAPGDSAVRPESAHGAKKRPHAGKRTAGKKSAGSAGK